MNKFDPEKFALLPNEDQTKVAGAYYLALRTSENSEAAALEQARIMYELSVFLAIVCYIILFFNIIGGISALYNEKIYLFLQRVRNFLEKFKKPKV